MNVPLLVWGGETEHAAIGWHFTTVDAVVALLTTYVPAHSSHTVPLMTFLINVQPPAFNNSTVAPFWGPSQTPSRDGVEASAAALASSSPRGASKPGPASKLPFSPLDEDEDSQAARIDPVTRTSPAKHSFASVSTE